MLGENNKEKMRNDPSIETPSRYKTEAGWTADRTKDRKESVPDKRRKKKKKGDLLKRSLQVPQGKEEVVKSDEIGEGRSEERNDSAPATKSIGSNDRHRGAHLLGQIKKAATHMWVRERRSQGLIPVL